MVDRCREPEPDDPEEVVISEERVAGLASALLDGDSASLNTEIAALRLVLARSLLEVRDPVRLATDVPRIASVLVRAAQVNKILAAGESDLARAISDVLDELGLGEEEE